MTFQSKPGLAGQSEDGIDGDLAMVQHDHERRVFNSNHSMMTKKLAVVTLLSVMVGSSSALSNRRSSRRNVLVAIGSATTTLLPAAVAAEGLGAKLAKKDPAALRNSVFNIPPAAQVYPDWMEGTWIVTSSFRGYMFPSDKIPKETLTHDFNVPGFQKCSIAATCDVGKENAKWTLAIGDNGLEDRKVTLASQVDGYLGYNAVADVLYDIKTNPNRLSIDFIDYKTINAERIELFCNARESETYTREDGARIFVCSEYIRQVTFGGGSEVGVPRQVIGNYGNFWTWKNGSDGTITGNLLTACYLDPQDSLFFDEPAKPVAIYSHSLSAERM